MNNLNKLEEKLSFENNTVVKIYCAEDMVRVVNLTTNDKYKREFSANVVTGTSLKNALKNAEKTLRGESFEHAQTGSKNCDSYLDLMLTNGFTIRIFVNKKSVLNLDVYSANGKLVYSNNGMYGLGLNNYFETAEDWAKEVLETLGYSLNQTANYDTEGEISRSRMYKVYVENVKKQ